MVHTAYQQEAAVHCDVGLYADERIRNFFAQVKTIMNETFQSLNDSLQPFPPAERSKRLAKGLAFLASESNQSMSHDEIARATQEFPNISHEYKRAMMRYAQCMVSGRKSSNIKVECSPFDAFLFKMYRRMATSTEVRSGRYFSMSYMEQEIFLKDVMRMVMGGCLVVRQVEETNAQSDVSYHSSHTSRVSRTSSRRPPPVLPSDSVSNITPNMTGGTVKVAKATALENALSVATENDKEEDTAAPSLTVFSLTEHKQRLAQREQQQQTQREQDKKSRETRPFTAPSIVTSRSQTRRHAGDSHIEKEVEILVGEPSVARGGGGVGVGVGGGTRDGGGTRGGGAPAFSGFFEAANRSPGGGNASDFMFEDDTSSSH